VGLLVYAGDAVVKCPLTPNFSHFMSVLDVVAYDAVSVAGTNLGRAIDKAIHEVFGRSDVVADPEPESATQPAIGRTVMDDERTGEAEAIFDHMVIFTDGENHEGHAKEMAKLASQSNISVFIVGIGSEAGATIPIERDGTTTTLRFGDEEVITRLDSQTLASIVLDDTGGVRHGGYLPAKTAAVDLREIYDEKIAPMGKRASQRRRTVWQEKFQLFAGAGMLLLIVASLISEQQPRRRKGVLA
jgi:Ca-activated chloride channel family protein